MKEVVKVHLGDFEKRKHLWFRMEVVSYEYNLQHNSITCLEKMQWIQILIEGNTHVSDLKEITVNIFGANEAEGSMEEYGMQDACSIAMFSISVSKRCVA